MKTSECGSSITLTAILKFIPRYFLLPVFTAMTLSGCGGSGGGGSGASSQQPTATGTSLVVAHVDNTASPVIAVVTDKNGKEKIALVGTKDATGAPVTMTEALYISASGNAGTLEIGADGLPVSFSDAVGNKVTFANYTDTTVDITVFDQAGNKVAGPVTVTIDAAALAKLRALSASQGIPQVTGAILGVSWQDWAKTAVDVAGLSVGLAGCGTIAIAGSLPAGPLGLLAGAACVSTLIDATRQITGTSNPPGLEWLSTLGDIGSCAVGVTGDVVKLAECTSAAIDGLGLVIPNDVTPPSVPTGLAVSVVDQTKASFYWTGSSDDVAVKGYRIFRDGNQVADVPITYYRDQNVTPGTRYCYSVVAYDAAGHSSGVSAALCIAVPSATSSVFLYVCDDAGVLGKVDAVTGSVTIIGSMGVVMTDIAFAPNGNLYGVTFDALYKIDPNTAAATFIGNLGASGINALAFRSDGTLFTASLTAQLYTVNTTTGQSSYIGYTLYSSAGDLVFDPDGNLIMASPLSLIELNTTADVAGYVYKTHIVDTYPYSFFGLASDMQNVLYGIAGTEIVSIDRTTWKTITAVNYAGKGLRTAYGVARR